MRCPSCLNPIEESVDACPHCHFSILGLDKRFGTVPRINRYITDLSSLFTERQERLLIQQIVRMERSFIGLHLAIVTMDVHRRFKPREYLFWLTNRCRFCPIDSREERSLFIVLFFDTASRTALLTTGYRLHATCSEEHLQSALATGLPEFKKNRIYHGSVAVFKAVAGLLKNQLRLQKSSATNPQPVRAMATSTEIEETT